MVANVFVILGSTTIHFRHVRSTPLAELLWKSPRWLTMREVLREFLLIQPVEAEATLFAECTRSPGRQFLAYSMRLLSDSSVRSLPQCSQNTRSRSPGLRGSVWEISTQTFL